MQDNPLKHPAQSGLFSAGAPARPSLRPMHSDLNPATDGFCRPTRSPLARSFFPLVRRARRGFALIVTLSMMTLLLLLVLTLTTLVRINMDTATANLVTAQARQNALLAAYIAIGQLQKFAGPDQRATATAYIGRGGQLPDPDDLTAEFGSKEDQVFGAQSGASNVINNNQTSNSDTPLTAPYILGGTWYWTGVWGPGVNPLALYTGLGTKFDNTTVGNAPDPILLNWLVSGDEGTPITCNFTATGVVAAPPATPGALAYTPDAGSKGAIASVSQPFWNNWTALTNDITMTPTNPPAGVKGAQQAALLVGPNTAYTGSASSYTITSATSNTIILKEPHTVNTIVAPIVTINNTVPTGSVPFTSGRYAFWVGDEGVKAKYTPVDPYVGDVTVTTPGDGGQLSRYRFWAPMRSAIERMVGMSSYGNINSPTGAANTSANSPAAKLKQMLDPSQIYFVDPNLPGIDPTGQRKDPTNPETSLEQNYFNFTTHSYGVLSDELRGGLRYDLTTAFNEISKGVLTAAFKDSVNGLQNRTILPGSNTNLAAGITATTEPNVVADGVHGNTLLSPVEPSGGSTVTFHGPNCPPPPGATNPLVGGLRWDALENFYNIAANNTSANPVPVQPGSTIKAGITPLITQFRLRFGQFADNISEQYVSVEPEFVLANPYSFPITDAGGGMDLGFRINTSTIPPGYTTGWEWFAGLNARNDIRQNLQGGGTSGESIALGYDTTQTVGLGGNASKASAFGINFTSTSGGSSQSVPGYYPFLKDIINYPTGLSASQGGFNSVLDNVAFHIPKGAASTFAPGEAKVFSLSNINAVTRTVAAAYNAPEGHVVAVVGSPLTGAQSGSSAISTGSIAAVLMAAEQPIFLSNLNLPSPFYLLRDTGISTAAGKYNNLNTMVNPDPDTQGFYDNVTGSVTDGLWPGHKFGYISTMDPGVAFTLELRSDLKEPTTGGSNNTTQTPYSSSGSSATVSNGVAGPGQNVLQSIVNMDLTGAGMLPSQTTTVQPSPVGYIPPFTLGQGFRRQYLGTTDPGKGAMPVFLTSYLNMLALPGPLGDGTTQQTLGSAANMVGFYLSIGDKTGPPQGWFDPSQYLAYRVYTDFNLRSVNMALPPFASFNSPWAGNNTTPTYGGVSGANNITAYLTTPPYGRVFDEGIDPDDSVPTGNEDVTFSQNSLGKNGQTGSGFANADDAAWGYANSLKGNGQQFVTLYSLPVKGAAPTETLGNKITVPDVPMMSLGQLTQADFTQDDIWCSVGYQPGHAFGNSYFSPYISRGASIQPHTNLSATSVLLTESPMTWLGGGNNAGKFILPTAINAYDISYLMNVALWDRYFFSTLVPSLSPNPANPRLVFAAGYSASTVSNLMQSSTYPTDPNTGFPNTTFVAYNPARFMMIDGAFNINSTSFEAWRAVLSALRGVAFSNGSGTGGSGNLTYYPRTMPSNNQTFQSSGFNVGVTDNNLGTGSANSGINDPPSYAGFRQLTDDEIDLLAAKIVQQVHQRGPFLSLAQFVNRNLQYQYTGGSTPDVHLIYSVSGPLQSALDMASGSSFPSFNAFFGTPAADSTVGLTLPGPPGGNTSSNSTGIYPDAPLYVKGNKPYTGVDNPSGPFSANPYSVITGIPGWLTQADLLQALAPILAARSDTFTIRTYGEVLNQSVDQANLLLPATDPRNPITTDPTAVQSRAWAEVVVQRMPDYIATDQKSMNDPSTTTGYCAPNPSAKTAPLSPVNAYFGRRFKIVSIKWLTADDI